MSLINEALKKAQKEGNGKDAPAARSPDVTLVTPRGRKPGLTVVAGGVVAILAGAAGVYFFTRNEPKSEVTSTALEVKKPTLAAEAPPAVKPPAAPVIPGAPSHEAKATVAISPVGDIAKSGEFATKMESPVAQKPAEPPAHQVDKVSVAPPVPVQNPEITAMLDRMKVSLGRKKTGRCVIDSVVFRVGEQLSSSPVINIKDVTDTEVVFTDVNGVEYAKKYK